MAAAATTPLDVVKTVMMCSASSRPTFLSAARSIMREGRGLRPFFRGVGPRALSNGLNSAIFFCFFEAIRQVLIKKQREVAAQQQQRQQQLAGQGQGQEGPQAPQPRRKLAAAEPLAGQAQVAAARQRLAGELAAASSRPQGSPAACLSLALPLPGKWGLHSKWELMP